MVGGHIDMEKSCMVATHFTSSWNYHTVVVIITSTILSSNSIILRKDCFVYGNNFHRLTRNIYQTIQSIRSEFTTTILFAVQIVQVPYGYGTCHDTGTNNTV
jgi:hypothetical protein